MMQQNLRAPDLRGGIGLMGQRHWEDDSTELFANTWWQ